jgi:hypothetical protein
MLIIFTEHLIYSILYFYSCFLYYFTSVPGQMAFQRCNIHIVHFVSKHFQLVQIYQPYKLPVTMTMHVSSLQALQQNKTFGMPSQTPKWAI